MSQSAEKSFFHHALTIREDICNGCSLCMRVCPTGALRIRNGKAMLIADRCVDCGECFRQCPEHAIIIEQDDFSRIFGFRHRVALVPAVLHGQFRYEISFDEISAVLKSLGFTWVYEVENSAGVVSTAINLTMNDRSLPRPLISTYCPAVVRLIQVRFPALVRNLSGLKTPLEMAAFYCRMVLRDSGAHNAEIGVFYVTPCASKIASVKAPLGEDSSPITGVINMDFIYNKINHTLRNKVEQNTESISQAVSPDFLGWSLTNGEASHVSGITMAIDGMNNVTEFLERLENDEISGIDYLELRACDEGCAGGVLLSSNRFLVAQRLRNKAGKAHEERQPDQKVNSLKPITEYSGYLAKKVHVTEEIKPMSMYRLASDRDKAMRMMMRSRRLMCWLPGTDCGLCGAPSCHALAEDVVRNRASISDCVFVREKNVSAGIMSLATASGRFRRIWGEENFEKNCNRKGAENESR